MLVNSKNDTKLYNALRQARRDSLIAAKRLSNSLKSSSASLDSEALTINSNQTLIEIVDHHISNNLKQNLDLHVFIVNLKKNVDEQIAQHEDFLALEDRLKTESVLQLYRAIFHVQPIYDDRVAKILLYLIIPSFIAMVALLIIMSEPLFVLLLATPAVIWGLTILADFLSFYPLVHSVINYIADEEPVIKEQELEKLAMNADLNKSPIQTITGTPYSYFDKIRIVSTESAQQPPFLATTESVTPPDYSIFFARFA